MTWLDSGSQRSRSQQAVEMAKASTSTLGHRSPSSSFYRHMPIGNVWMYRLPVLFVCFRLLVCLFVRLRISPPRIKLAASNFARRFVGVQGRESSILGNFARPEALPEAHATACALGNRGAGDADVRTGHA